MIQKPIDQIEKEDITSLVTAKVSERRTLDYKLQLPGNSDGDKREFLYDVSSFANAAGGDLVFGVADERDANGKPTGLPASADGLVLPNVSEAKLRLDNLVRDGIDPRVQGIRWREIEGFPKGPILVLRIPKSWVGPHMVTIGGVSRFYSRNSGGKYPLDVGEIRSAFLAQAGIGERIRRFLAERIAKVEQGESPIALRNGAKALLHLIPISAVDPMSSRDVAKDAALLNVDLQPMSGSAWGARFNFDGVVVSGRLDSYVQVFRSGVVEGCDGYLFSNNNSIPSIAFEQKIWNAAARYLRVLRKLQIPLPIFIAVSLVGVKGFTLGLSEWFMMTHDGEARTAIDRDILMLPEGLIEDYTNSIPRVLRPAFDALWQACGFAESANYDAEGNWRAHT